MGRYFIGLLVAVLFLSGCESRARDFEQVSSQEKIVLKFSHVVSDASPKGRAARRWSELVNQRSGGKVEIQVFPNSTLFKDGEELEALKKGYVQIIAPATSKLTKEAPAWQLLDLPFFFEDMEQVHRVVDGEVGDTLALSLLPKGVKVLGFWDNGFKQMTANRTLQSVRDFQGLRFRIMDSPVLVEQFQRLGAKPVALPFSDVYTAMERNQVDGGENTASNLYSKKFYHLQKNLTISNHGYLGYAVLVNSRQWQALPADIRGLLAATFAEVTAWERQEALRQNQEDLARIRNEKETAVHDLTPDEMQAWKAVLYPLRQEVQAEVGAELLQQAENEKNKISRP